MSSLARPRKITLIGSDGKTYPFLGKPQDDLRKDARLMDFYAIINKLLQSNSESRRRRLRKSILPFDVSAALFSFISRYSNIWCCHFERDLRLHSVGRRYPTTTTYLAKTV